MEATTNLHDLLATFLQKNGYAPLNDFLKAHAVTQADDTTGIPGVTGPNNLDDDFSADNVDQVNRKEPLNLGNYDGEDVAAYHEANPEMTNDQLKHVQQARLNAFTAMQNLWQTDVSTQEV